MKFAFMGRILDYEGYGMKTLLSGLLKSIAKTNGEHEIFVFLDPEQPIPEDLNGKKIEFIPVSPKTSTSKGKLLWDHFSTGLKCKQLQIDALYAPAHIRPFFSPCPVVVSVFDMMYHRFPQFWSLSDRVYFRLAVSLLTSKAAYISALSENTKKDIQAYLKIPPEKVEVIYPGVPEGFRVYPPSKTHYIRGKYLLEKPYILYVGSFHPRKNFLRLLEAYEEIAFEIEHDLVSVGSKDWDTPLINKRINESEYASRVRNLGLICRDDLAMLYNMADVFVFPSLYEGFGFPVLEAMACGCPVISTRLSSIPEVTGDASILLEQENLNELSDVILKVLTDRNLRKRLVEASLLQSKKFDWETAARKTIKLLEEAVISSN